MFWNQSCRISLSSDFETGFEKAFDESSRDCFEDNEENNYVNDNKASRNITLHYVQMCCFGYDVHAKRAILKKSTCQMRVILPFIIRLLV